ncbi:hypothetical protein FA10DRAFT_200815 [Acaromyces ingoldii]|uniref:MACPF domain-containing protein n=1 Tax=Acaromyces ingoldii TaxID=215250 RepID=A0A316YBA5_9BASI|nr:hypothetical protein FA10DRAFT_200815 [Acaromyces ingoldii]PWN86837.1 hypothetical protein FA10DRAFT_200815 [Acaromyces ingoldii]
MDGDRLLKEALADGQEISSGKPTLQQLARQRLPITVPWSPGLDVYPGQTFHSRLYRTADPWAKRSPFEGWSGEHGAPLACGQGGQMVYLCADGGTTGTFRSAKTQSTVVKEDHESYGFSATVDLGFCNASGSLQYDRNISTNNDDIKTSVRSSYRCGSILMRTAPALSQEAGLALKYGDGIDEFEERFGDYVLFGFNLGADNAMMVSTSAASLSTQERKSLTVKATALLFDVEYTEHFDSSSYAATSALSINGYDTLAGTTLNQSTSWKSSASVEFDEVQRKTKSMRLLGDTLPSRVEAKAREAGLPLGRNNAEGDDDAAGRGLVDFAPIAGLETAVDRDTCRRLFASGLVVEVVLMPCRSLRSVQKWMCSDDVI